MGYDESQMFGCKEGTIIIIIIIILYHYAY